MSKPSRKSFTSKFSRPIRLRTAIAVPFVLQILGTVGLVGYLSFQTGKQAINDLATQLQKEITARIEEKLDNYLATPHLINGLNTGVIGQGLLDVKDVEGLQKHFWHQIQSFDTVSTIGFTSQSGTTIAVRRINNDKFHILVADNFTNGELHEYATSDRGTRTYLHSILKNYDPRIRPWYLDGIQAKKPAVWGEAFASLLDRKFEIMATRQVADETGNVIGLATTTLILSQVDDFLDSLDIGKSGEAFIINREGQSIASSTNQQTFVADSSSAKMLDAAKSSDPLLRQTMQHLTETFGDLVEIERTQQLKFSIDGETQFLQVVPFSDDFGLDWLIVVAIPRGDFMDGIYANTRTTIGLCLAASILTIFLGLLASEWIAKPVRNLKEAAIALSMGKWNQTVANSNIDELEIFAQTFNQMARQLQNSLVKLEEKNRELQEIDRLKDEFMKNISHQLRTPLNGIIGSLRLLLEGGANNPAEEVELLLLADKSAIHVLYLINEILDLVQIKSGKLPIDIQLVNLHESLSEAIALMRPQLCKKNLMLFKHEFSESILVKADPIKLKQVFLNLLDNAIKFTDSGSITITTDIKPGLQSYDIEQTPLAVVSFQDTGIGMDAVEKQQLFQSLGLTDNSTTRFQASHGLGLAISRGLMELMGGSITLESAGKNQGTTVAIALPISFKIAS